MLCIRYLLLASMTLFLSATVMAQEVADNTQDLIITSIPGSPSASEVLNSSDPDLNEQELKITYNPKDFEGISDKSGNKQQLLKSLRDEMKLSTDNSIVKIPQAPVTNEQMQNIELLNESELQLFLGKKQKFLERVSKVMGFFHLKPKMVNKVLNEINNQFYNSSRVIATSNSIGGTLMFSLSGGLALPKKIVEKLENRSLGKFIPKSGGFAYLLGIGVGVARHIQKNGHPNWILDVFIDVERLKSSVTGFALASLAGTFGIAYELREGSLKSESIDTTYAGVAGIFKQSENQFGWATTGGVSFPPIIDDIFVFTTVTTRHYLLRVNFSKFKEASIENTKAFLLSWMEKTGLRKGPSPLCSEVLL